MTKPKFYLLNGPEGFSDRPLPYHDLNGLVQAAARFVLRYVAKGYYLDTNMNRQPLEWVANHLSVRELDVKRTATQAYTAYVNDNLERIASEGWVPLCFDEFIDSEEFENLTDIDIDDPVLNSNHAEPGGNWFKAGEIDTGVSTILITDPIHIQNDWDVEDDTPLAPYFEDRDTGQTYYCSLHGLPHCPGSVSFGHFEEPLKDYSGWTPNRLIKEGRWIKKQVYPEACPLSYAGSINAVSDGYGQLLDVPGTRPVGVAVACEKGNGIYQVLVRHMRTPDGSEIPAEIRIVLADPKESYPRVDLATELLGIPLLPSDYAKAGLVKHLLKFTATDIEDWEFDDKVVVTEELDADIKVWLGCRHVTSGKRASVWTKGFAEDMSPNMHLYFDEGLEKDLGVEWEPPADE